MIRKHYIAVAKLISDELEFATVATAARREAAQLSLSNVARGLANLFVRDNSRFDRQRFFYACGLNENGRVEAA